MQLREYLAILRRFWPIVLLLPILAGGLSLALAVARPPRFQASARLMVSQASLDPAASADLPDYNNNYSWLVSEYILDDLPQVVTSVAFAEDVQALASADGYELAVPAIQSGLRAEVLHRSVFLAAVADTPDQALATVRAAVAALQRGGLKYWGRAPAEGGGLQVAILDPPGGLLSLASARALLLDVALRTALALAAAIGLAFLLHSFDDRLRSPRQAEQWTGARVLAVIPKEQL